MTDNRNPKRQKSISQWFTPSSVNESEHHVTCDGNNNEMRNMSMDSVKKSLDPSLLILSKDDPKKRIVEEIISDTTSLERDPGKCQSIGKYPSNERDYIWRAYVLCGSNQPHLKCYLITYGVNGRRFNKDWFLEWPWLEYSVTKDKAYCFPCFLFDSYPSRHPQFTENGFHGWKNILFKSSGIVTHVGGINFIHSSSMYKWENLRNPSKHIERVMITFLSQEVANNRLRLTASIEVVKLLACRGCFFIGNDESIDSLSRGNFDAILDLVKRLNEDYRKVLDNAPKTDM